MTHDFEAPDGWALCKHCGKTKPAHEPEPPLPPGVCPSCKGSKGGTAMLCGRGPGTGYRWMPCSFCKGTGKATEEQSARYAQARTIHKDRVERRVTIREEAKRLGCDFGEWSRIEHGDEPETEAGARALAVRLQELDSAARSAL